MSNFRRRLMMSFEKKYTPVKYLESTGTQYIDTNYKPNGNTIIELKYQTPTQNTIQQGIFGARDRGNNRFSLFTGSVKNGFQADYATGNSLLSFNQNIPGVDDTAINVIKMSNSFTINNNDIKKISKVNFQNSQNMYLFANNNNGIAQLPMKGYIWYFKIYEGDTLVRDYIPVIDSSNRPCLYDKVEDKFYYNEGSGEFLYE